MASGKSHGGNYNSCRCTSIVVASSVQCSVLVLVDQLAVSSYIFYFYFYSVECSLSLRCVKRFSTTLSSKFQV